MITEDGTRLRGPRRLLPETLHEYVELGAADCWIWQRHIDRHGYGKGTFGGKKGGLAHRAVYEMLVGPIPDGLTLDHLCRNPPCVNPDHLEPVTSRENLRRSPLKMHTHCIHGHRLTGANAYEPAGRPGRRQCRACHRDASLRYMRRIRAKAVS